MVGSDVTRSAAAEARSTPRGLSRLLDPDSIAIVGLSEDRTKHGARVFGHLMRLGYPGIIWGVHPKAPKIEGVEVYPSVASLPSPPDLVVCAVPAAVAVDVIAECAGVGAVIVHASGFAESGEEGLGLQRRLLTRANEAGTRILGPNSAGVIRPGEGLAASFLTCLDRPTAEIRSGPVAVVTQSGGLGSHLHNLAAGRGGGLAISVSTGNEIDIRLGEAIASVTQLDEVRAVVVLIETVRDGEAFIGSLHEARRRGTPVVACRIGKGQAGMRLMTSHTGAMAAPEAVLGGVLDALGVLIAETPGEAYDVAEMLSRAGTPSGNRAGIVTHSGGTAILLADLAERHGVETPQPSAELAQVLEPLLDHGTTANPLDMGGIIGGPGRFGEVIDACARSEEFDMLLAVSTPHPPQHSQERVATMLALQTEIPLLHLWMAGDQGAESLGELRDAGSPVTEDPRTAVLALAGLDRLGRAYAVPEPLRAPFEDWGVPLVEGRDAGSPEQAADAADELGYPAVVKLVSVPHKTDVGGVRLNLPDRVSVARACEELLASAGPDVVPSVRVQRYRPGLEMIVGAIEEPTFGPLVSVGVGGILTEVIADVVFSPAPVDPLAAMAMIDRLRDRRLLDGFRGDEPTDVTALAEIVSTVSRGLVGSDVVEVEVNPLVWDGEWVAVDWLVVRTH